MGFSADGAASIGSCGRGCLCGSVCDEGGGDSASRIPPRGRWSSLRITRTCADRVRCASWTLSGSQLTRSRSSWRGRSAAGAPLG